MKYGVGTPHIFFSFFAFEEPWLIYTQVAMKKHKRIGWIALGVLGVIGLSWGIIALLPRPHSVEGVNPMIKTDPLPLLIAHGGGNREFPDNTLEAYYNAYSADPNVMLETDVSITKDGVIIMSHDIQLAHKSNGSGFISDWNYTDLIKQRIDFSYLNDYQTIDGVDTVVLPRHKFANDQGVMVTPKDVSYPKGVELVNGVPKGRDPDVFLATRLEDALIAFPHNKINVEIKQDGAIGKKAFQEVIRLLTKYDAFDRVVLASFHDDIFDAFEDYQAQSGNKAFMYSPGVAAVTRYYLLQVLSLDVFFDDKIAVFQLPTDQYGIDLTAANVIWNAHRHNVAVHYWTINDPDEMKTLIQKGVDGIMTDYPHRLKEVYDSYGSSDQNQ